MNPIRNSSTAAKMFVVLAVIITTGYFGGCLGKTSVERDEAIQIARGQIDFVPEQTNAELGRQGFPPTAVWGITFWIEAKDGGGWIRTSDGGGGPRRDRRDSPHPQRPLSPNILQYVFHPRETFF